MSQQLHAAIRERILILDGAMGTMIQRYQLSEADYRGERFKDWPCDLKGNNDLISITQISNYKYEKTSSGNDSDRLGQFQYDCLR